MGQDRVGGCAADLGCVVDSVEPLSYRRHRDVVGLEGRDVAEAGGRGRDLLAEVDRAWRSPRAPMGAELAVAPR